MLINFIPQRFNNNINNNAAQSTQYSRSYGVSQYPNLKGLKSDTVSFTATIKMSDHIEECYAAGMERLNRIATTFLDALEAVALRLKDKGYSFDRAYNEKNPVKSKKSYIKKVARRKSFKIQDTIRGTIYCSNPYDLSKLVDDLLPEMKKRGYVLANVEKTVEELMKRGYVPKAKELKNPKETIIEVPDLDIRLEDVSDQLSKLSPDLRYSIGKPQKSGYEDIQMRFVREFDKKSNPVQHELIIMFGPNTALAKEHESKDIYSFTRQFEELSMEFDGDEVGSNNFRTLRYIDMIKQMFWGKVSNKLFANAKNKDYAGIEGEIPISFSDTDIAIFENCFGSIRKGLKIAYKDAAKKTDINKDAANELNKNYNRDKNIIDEIYNGLKSAIEKYGNLSNE